MCLAVPGRILAVGAETLLGRTGTVDFGGVTREVCLAFVPEAQAGEWVLVHVGFALGVIDEAEAQQLLTDLATLTGADSGREEA